MKKRLLFPLLTGMIVVMLAGIAFADMIRDRIDNQQRRIDQGIMSGELTRGEADVVQDNLNYIRDEYARFRANDGVVGPVERDRLNDMLDRNSRMIENKKHNPIAGFRGGFRDDWGGRRWDWDRSMTISERIDNQQARINHGINIGELTRREANVIQDNLDYIKREFARARNNDGVVGPVERDRLHNLLDRNSRMIFDRKHNPFQRIY